MQRIKATTEGKHDCVTPHPRLTDMIEAHQARIAEDLRRIERTTPPNERSKAVKEAQVVKEQET